MRATLGWILLWKLQDLFSRFGYLTAKQKTTATHLLFIYLENYRNRLANQASHVLSVLLISTQVLMETT